jgi:hypothetical protein
LSVFDVSFAIEADVMTVGFDWLLWLLVGALGGLLALLSAVAVANSYRRRHRTPRGGARQREPLRGGEEGPAPPSKPRPRACREEAL